MKIAYGLECSDLEGSKTSEIYELIGLMNEYFKGRSYSSAVETFNIWFLCDSPVYEQFSVPKRPRYVAEKSAPKPKYLWEDNSDNMYHTIKTLFIEIKVDHQSFSQSDKIGGYTIIGNTLLRYLEEMKYPVALRKSFDRERFNRDMKEFFQSLGCRLNMD